MMEGAGKRTIQHKVKLSFDLVAATLVLHQRVCHHSLCSYIGPLQQHFKLLLGTEYDYY